MRLDGKVCVVTGAGRGIGRATAIEMARQGARAIAVSDVDAETSAETVALVRAAGADAEAFLCDVSEGEQVRALMDGAVERFGAIDVLHNNAGIVDTQVTDRTRIEELSEDAWDRIFAVNVRGTWLGIKHAVPHMRAAGGGSIVNAASVSSYLAYEGESAYCASKAAVVLLTRSAALDLARDGIRCTCYCPATIDTPMFDAYTQWAGSEGEGDDDPLDSVGTATHLLPEKRRGTPEEVARLVCFLASDAASFINGSAHMIDGGSLAWRGSFT
jgi:NAD(P)-dependent dehydrogenase (short-subunit alcohol dehydrogenase family)